MPTTKQQQKHTINEAKREIKQKDAEISKLKKQLQKDLDKKEADLRKLAAQALRAGSSQGGKMMSTLKKK